VLGTTSETAGFDRSLDEGTLAGIQAAVARLVPAVASAPRTEAWAGFRPRLADGLPAIGPVPSRPGLFVATGHYRNGILLAEVTGRLVADAVLGRVDPACAAFSPERFGTSVR
jgi:glycine oxidase